MSTVVKCEKLTTSIQELLVENNDYHNTIEDDIQVVSTITTPAPQKRPSVRKLASSAMPTAQNTAVKYSKLLWIEGEYAIYTVNYDNYIK